MLATFNHAPKVPGLGLGTIVMISYRKVTADLEQWHLQYCKNAKLPQSSLCSNYTISLGTLHSATQ